MSHLATDQHRRAAAHGRWRAAFVAVVVITLTVAHRARGADAAAASDDVAHAFAFKPATGPAPKTVHVAGDFNDWSTSNNELTKAADGTYRGSVKVSPGKHAYK